MLWGAWTARGAIRARNDNAPMIREIVALRAEQARLLGYANFADYRLDDTMAKTSAAVERLLLQVWEPAKDKARERAGGAGGGGPRRWIERGDRAVGLALLRREGPASAVRPRRGRDKAVFRSRQYGAGGIRHRRPAVRPDLQRARRSPGLSSRCPGLGGSRRAGSHVGLFLHDNFARPGKQSGAWSSRYRDQENMDEPVAPIVVNNNNFARGSDAGGEPTLLSFDDARTLFHEFGHGLHSLLSRVRYRSQSGTAVLRDFVEFPSQIFEHWMSAPETLRTYARHYRTGEPMPEEMLERLLAARNFNQGFATVEYTASRPDRSRSASRNGAGRRRSRAVRARIPGPDGGAEGDRAASPAAAFPASVRRRRLCRRLLRLSLGRGAGCRRLCRVYRGGRCLRSRARRAAQGRSTAPATRATRWSSIARFAVASRTSPRCWNSAGCLWHVEERLEARPSPRPRHRRRVSAVTISTAWRPRGP